LALGQLRHWTLSIFLCDPINQLPGFFHRTQGFLESSIAQWKKYVNSRNIVHYFKFLSNALWNILFPDIAVFQSVCSSRLHVAFRRLPCLTCAVKKYFLTGILPARQGDFFVQNPARRAARHSLRRFAYRSSAGDRQAIWLVSEKISRSLQHLAMLICIQGRTEKP